MGPTTDSNRRIRNGGKSSPTNPLLMIVEHLALCSDVVLFEEFLADLEGDEMVDVEVLAIPMKTLGWDSLTQKFTTEKSFEFIQELFNQAFIDDVLLTVSSNVHTIIQSYSPDTLLQLVFNGDDPTVKSVNFTGACLIADISGFTKMSSAFCAKGPQGLDDLHRTTNGFLGYISGVVYRFRGDVIAFAGDAVICVFRDPKNVEKTIGCCRRALECALELSEKDMSGLKSHIGVSYGEMSLAMLGGYNDQWNYILNGDCLSQLSNCLDDAASKEVVVTNSFYDTVVEEIALSPIELVSEHIPATHNHRVDKILVVAEDGSKSPLEPAVLNQVSTVRSIQSRFATFFIPTSPGLPPLIESRSTSILTNFAEFFIPKQVQDAVELGNFSSMSELREVTTLFLKLDTYDIAKHKNTTTLQGFFYMIQEALFKTGGFLRQFLVDDKGCVVIGMWGVTGFSYPDNNMRAVQCATEIRKQGPSVGHTFSMGISTGTVYCGNVGSVERRDFVGIGHNVNMAARLMGKSQGRILVDSVTHGLLSDKAKKNITDTLELKLKGVENLMTVFVCNLTVMGGADDVKDDSDMMVFPIYIGSAITHRIEAQIELIDDINRFDLLMRGVGTEKLKSEKVHSGRWVKKDKEVISVFESKGHGSMKQQTHWEALEAKFGLPLRAVSCTVLIGPVGSGKQLACQYLLTKAVAKGARSIRLMARANDVPFTVMRKLFFNLLGSDADEGRIHNALRELILNTFPYLSRSSNVRTRLYLSLCVILGIDSDTPASTSFRSVRSARFANGASSNLLPPMAKQDVFMTDEKLFHMVICYQLINQSTVLVIENCHFCDEMVWKEFMLLMDMPICLTILLTTVMGHNNEERKKMVPGKVSMPSRTLFGNKGRSLDQFDRKSRSLDQFDRKSQDYHDNLAYPTGASFDEIDIMEKDAVFAKKLKKQPSAKNMSIDGGDLQNAQNVADSLIGVDGSMLAKLQSHDRVKSLEMPIFNRVTIRILLLHYWDMYNVPERLVDLVYDASNLNAHLCRSIVKHIQSHGIVSFIKKVNNSASQAVYMLSVCGFDALKPNEKVFVKFASVVGEEFSIECVQCLLPKNITKSIPAILESLVGHGIIVSDPEGGTYSFQIGAVAQAFYQLIPKSEAIALHTKLAIYIETKYFFALEKYYRLLSYHNSKSPARVSIAFKFHVLCADQSLSLYCYDDALSYLTKAKLCLTTCNEKDIFLKVIALAIKDIRSPPEVLDVDVGTEDVPNEGCCVPLFGSRSSKTSRRISIFDGILGDYQSNRNSKRCLEAYLSFENQSITDTVYALYQEDCSGELDWEPAYVMSRLEALAENQ